MPARVLIRFAGDGAEARRRAESLANALSRQGVEVADLRESAAAIQTELSFSYPRDEAIARHVGRLVGVAPVRRLQPKDALMAGPGTVELSLSGDSHAAAIKTTQQGRVAMTKRILPFILVTSCVPTTFCPSTGNDKTVCVALPSRRRNKT
jgi:hypothetical protein